MIRDARILRDGYQPSDLEHRNQELNHLATVLEPITHGEPADTVLLTGPSGSGKTTLAKFATDQLREQVLDVKTAYVNCWRKYNSFRALYEILDELDATLDIHRQSTPHDELVDRLETYEGPRVVVILDEADQLEDPEILYDLHSLEKFAMICIANREEELFGKMDERLVSRLRSAEHVPLGKYGNEELFDILEARAKRALVPEAITDEQLYRIADAAAGDARLAIGILRSAAAAADRAGKEQITDDILLDAAEDARTELRQRNIDTLTSHQKAVYEIVRKDGPLSPGEIFERYENLDHIEEPRTKRSVRSYLQKMVQYNLLEAEGSSRDRTYALAGTVKPSP